MTRNILRAYVRMHLAISGSSDSFRNHSNIFGLSQSHAQHFSYLNERREIVYLEKNCSFQNDQTIDVFSSFFFLDQRKIGQKYVKLLNWFGVTKEFINSMIYGH